MNRKRKRSHSPDSINMDLLPTFNGEGNVKKFISDFERALEGHNINNIIKKGYIIRCLEGRALEKYDFSSGKLNTYEDILNYLGAEYRSNKSSTILMVDLLRLNPEVEETVDSYATRLQSLYKRTLDDYFPIDGNFAQHLLRSIIIDKLLLVDRGVIRGSDDYETVSDLLRAIKVEPIAPVKPQVRFRMEENQVFSTPTNNRSQPNFHENGEVFSTPMSSFKNVGPYNDIYRENGIHNDSYDSYHSDRENNPHWGRRSVRRGNLFDTHRPQGKYTPYNAPRTRSNNHYDRRHAGRRNSSNFHENRTQHNPP